MKVDVPTLLNFFIPSLMKYLSVSVFDTDIEII
jgi:hypothetical protein